MTDYYMDAGSGASGNTGTSWSQAMDTLQNLLAKMSAGDRGFIRQGTVDTYATSQTFQSPGDYDDGAILIGVKSGTTAEPPTKSDMSIRGTDTLAKIQVTGANQTMYLDQGFSLYGLEFEVLGGSVLGLTSGATKVTAHGCRFHNSASNLRLFQNQNFFEAFDCEFDAALIEASGFAGVIRIIGGEIVASNTSYIISNANYIGGCYLKGVDLSGSSGNDIFEGGVGNGYHIAENCKLDTGMGLVGSDPAGSNLTFEMIGCSDNTSAKGSATSYQEYEFADLSGEVDTETIAVRTGGADDGASGDYSFALTPYADETREGLQWITTPWLSRWVGGGVSKTFSVYVANSGAGDYDQDEMWCEFLTPDDGDTAQHDYTIKPDDYKGVALGSGTAVADDTGSTWGTGAANAQKFEFTSTPGYEGFVYARVHFGKRFASSPETLYVDPLIGVS